MKGSDSPVKRLLIIEDEPAIRQICQRVLTEDGFEVDTAVNGKAAQKMLKVNDYSLILVDIKTPGMNGREFYDYLMKERPEMVERVILTTGALMSGDIIDFLESSERPLLPKPFTPDELRGIVQKTLKELA